MAFIINIISQQIEHLTIYKFGVHRIFLYERLYTALMVNCLSVCLSGSVGRTREYSTPLFKLRVVSCTRQLIFNY